MKNAIILHGTENNPNDNWFPWLKKELERKGFRVWVPFLPCSDKPNVDKYNSFLLPDWQYNSDTFLIGHSSGAVAILSLLQNLPKGTVINKAILVAGFKDNLEWDALDGLFIHSYDWEKIKRRCKEFVFIHSDNDPYVPMEHGKFLHGKLGGRLIVKKGQKHFSISSFGEKYKQFPLILDLLS